MNRRIPTIVGVAVLHFALTVFLFISSFHIVMDPGDPPATTYQTIAAPVAHVLMWPVFVPLCAHTPVGRLFPGLLGYIPMFINSLVWAIPLVLIFERLARSRVGSQEKAEA